MSLITTGNFDCKVLRGPLYIGHASPAELPECCSTLIRQLLFFEISEESEFGSILAMDSGGVTVVLNNSLKADFIACGAAGRMRWLGEEWRALEIHLGPSGSTDEAPGLISFVASLLSSASISVMAYSTVPLTHDHISPPCSHPSSPHTLLAPRRTHQQGRGRTVESAPLAALHE